MTTPDLEGLARAVERLTAAAKSRRAGVNRDARHRREPVSEGEVHATIGSVLLTDIEAVLAALIRSAPAPGREEIARIIDPSIWKTLDMYFAEAVQRGGKPDRARYKDGQSLAKADAILALFHAPAEAGGGEARPAYAPLAVDHSTSVYEMPVAPTPPAGDGWRNPSQLWARDLTDEELIDEYRRNEEACDRFDEARRDPDYEGHGGSPGEGLYERNEELEGQLKKRGLWPLPPPPVSKGEK